MVPVPGPIRGYIPPKLGADEVPMDGMLLMALIMGVVGFMLRTKVACWAALFCCVSSFVCARWSEIDYKQLLMSTAFTLFGLYGAYFGPQAAAASS